MMLKCACLLVVLAASALADVSSIVDAILEQTRGRLPDSIPYRQLHYADKSWNPATKHFDKEADLVAHNGHLLLGTFKREGTPVVFGNSKEGILESDLKVQYENFTAVNFTSGAKSSGSMSVSYDVAEMFTWIKMSKQGGNCQAEVSTYTPISMGDPVAVFTPATPLTQALFADAKHTLNFYMNQTLVEEGLPAFADVVSKSTNLCTLMSK